jgi:hypothetical protein
MPSTYTRIASTVVPSDTPSVTFSSIPATYTDLRCVIQARVASASFDYFAMRFNGVTSSSYPFTWMAGTTAGAQTGKFGALTMSLVGWATSNAQASTDYSIITVDIMNYSNTTNYKTAICRSGTTNDRSDLTANLFMSTSAINSISVATWGSGTFGGVNLRAGSTIALYGIKSA